MSLLAVILERTPEEIAQAEADKLNPKPEPVPDASYTEDEYQVYRAARRVADIVFEELEANDGTTEPATRSKSLWVGCRRQQTVNPFYSQTLNGLRLEISYSTPKSIHTPWGDWSITGGASYSGNACEFFMDAVLARLNVETHIARYYATGLLGGVVGPVYNIGGVDGAPLPAATDHVAGAQRRSYIDAIAQWRAMSDRYSEENPNAIKMQYFY